METSNTTGSIRENLLLAMHKQLAKAITNFRKKVSAECRWSPPTYYRKMRAKDVLDRKNRGVAPLSNAEKDKISSLYCAEIHRLNEWFQKNVVAQNEVQSTS
ncbi:MAG TPA: hypothetical protein VM802_10090 [Chitinophaga sp.]|uniref:hypothetical protein n=1 Tax=Chitinophaga sp. TaxID=1869181 RepID=UPI002BFD0433|nr:hypothetical protein [Chitinophaga sp.]HVI45212.1 hypothetical protein [Chitinophaga sp.]